MGELHLEIISDRLIREFKVGATVGRPQVAYKETIKRHSTKASLFVNPVVVNTVTVVEFEPLSQVVVSNRK